MCSDMSQRGRGYHTMSLSGEQTSLQSVGHLSANNIGEYTGRYVSTRLAAAFQIFETIIFLWRVSNLSKMYCDSGH